MFASESTHNSQFHGDHPRPQSGARTHSPVRPRRIGADESTTVLQLRRCHPDNISWSLDSFAPRHAVKNLFRQWQTSETALKERRVQNVRTSMRPSTGFTFHVMRHVWAFWNRAQHCQRNLRSSLLPAPFQVRHTTSAFPARC